MNLRLHKRRAYDKRGMQWGKRCSEYFAGCICCEAWRFYDETGRFPTFDEARASLQKMRH
jgi:hypothetical protein